MIKDVPVFPGKLACVVDVSYVVLDKFAHSLSVHSSLVSHLVGGGRNGTGH